MMIADGRELSPKRFAAALLMKWVVPATPASIKTHSRSGAPGRPKKRTLTMPRRLKARSAVTSWVGSSLAVAAAIAEESIGICGAIDTGIASLGRHGCHELAWPRQIS